jgi:hypothetical protein
MVGLYRDSNIESKKSVPKILWKCKKIQIPWNQQPTHPNIFIQQNEENDLEGRSSLSFTLLFNGRKV